VPSSVIGGAMLPHAPQASLTCELAVGDEHRESDAWATPELDERRYVMRVVKQRLHQSMFRERVICSVRKPLCAY
jgi:hypothetical protein